MKVQSLFDLVNAAYGVLSFFENVNTAEQVVSRLERLKRGGYPEEVLGAVDELRAATEQMMSDTVDMHPETQDFDPEDEDEDELDDGLGDPELDALTAEEPQGTPQSTSTESQPEAEQSTTPDHHPV